MTNSPHSDSNLKKTLDSLWKNWLFRLSLSSNELFHSNILQYLTENQKINSDTLTTYSEPTDEDDGNKHDLEINELKSNENIPQIIDSESAIKLLDLLSTNDNLYQDIKNKINSGGILSVHREWKNMDLAVLMQKDGVTQKNGDPLFALEVKIKSYPTVDQLKNYLKVLNTSSKDNSQPMLFLLTGMGEDVAKEINFVQTVSFSNISDILKKSKDEKNVVREEYIKLCDLLTELFSYLKKILTPESTLEQANNVANILRPYRLHAIFWKLWASTLESRCIKPEPKPKLEPDEPSTILESEVAYSREGILTRSWGSHVPGSSSKIRLGVQVQGNSMRLFLSVKKLHLPSGTNIRQVVENILLTLCATEGVFLKNPRINDYQNEWIRFEKIQYNNYTNKWKKTALTDIDKIAHSQDLEYEIKNNKEMKGSWGKKSGNFYPRLHGYTNSQTDGFADFRLTLNPNNTISALAKKIDGILFDNDYSIQNECYQEKMPILKSIVEEFISNEKNWWKKYSDLNI